MTESSAVGQLLHEEHLQTLALMNALEARTTGKNADRPLDASAEGDRKSLRELIAIVDRDIHRHFRFEEDALFPLLAQAGAGDMTEVLLQDHEAIRGLAEPLLAVATHALDAGFTDRTWEEFRDAAMDLVPSVLFHIQKEEMGLVKRLEFFLDAETDRNLATRYAAHGG